MDESGQSGDTGAAESGTGAEARERHRVNGWAAADSPWSHAGAALESEDDVPAWRRPGTESRSFPRSPAFPSSAPASGLPAPAPAPQPPGFVDAQRSGEIPPSGESYGADRWAESRSRYSDLLSSRTPPPAPPAQRTEPGPATGENRPERPTSLRSFDVPTPNSAPPYPYEGDLDDTPAVPPPAQRRAAVPLVRPATPGGRRAEQGPADPEPPRHALNPAVTQSLPRVDTAEGARPGRRSYDPSSFPRRLPSHEAAPAAASPGYVPPAAYAAFDRGPGATDPRPADPAARVLPQRVPAQPDVPRVPEPPLVEPTAETPALARIATHLRRGDVLPVQERQEGFDVQAILGAVREVDGVRDASLRTTPTGAHSLRLDLAEGADPAEVSRVVARLLQERMGLDAAMQGEAPPAVPAPATPPPAVPRATAPVSPATVVPTGRPARPISAPPAPASALPAPASALPAAPAQPRAQAPTAAPAPTLPPSSTQPASTQPASTEPASTEPAPTQPASARPAPTQSASARPSTPTLAPSSPAPSSPAPLSPAAPPAATPSSPAPSSPAPSPPAAAAGAAPATPLRTAAPSRAEGRPERSERSERATGNGAVEPTGVDYRPPRPLYPGEHPGPRIVIENVHVNTFGTEATVSVRLSVGPRTAAGEATGPAVDGYLLRLCAMATAGAVDQLLASSDDPDGPARCFVEHAAAVPFGASHVAVVVLLLSWGGWVEQLAGSAVVTGDDRHAMVRATLAAVNRRLEALLTR